MPVKSKLEKRMKDHMTEHPVHIQALNSHHSDKYVV